MRIIWKILYCYFYNPYKATTLLFILYFNKMPLSEQISGKVWIKEVRGLVLPRLRDCIELLQVQALFTPLRSVQLSCRFDFTVPTFVLFWECRAIAETFSSLTCEDEVLQPILVWLIDSGQNVSVFNFACYWGVYAVDCNLSLMRCGIACKTVHDYDRLNNLNKSSFGIPTIEIYAPHSPLLVGRCSTITGPCFGRSAGYEET